MMTGIPRTRDDCPRIPAGMVVYAVGDVHGRLDLLTRLHAMIQDDAREFGDSRKVLIHLGDYLDRGASSAAVIDFLLDEPCPGFETIDLKGNHEDFILRFLDDLSVGSVWLYNGGYATLTSYGITARWRPGDVGELIRLQHRLREAIPARHRAFLEGLAIRHVVGDYVFVHAGLRPGVALERQNDADLMWIRNEFLASQAWHGKMVVHGHTVTDAPDIRANRIGIDTGAYASDVLTALVLHGGERRFVHT